MSTKPARSRSALGLSPVGLGPVPEGRGVDSVSPPGPRTKTKSADNRRSCVSGIYYGIYYGKAES